MIIQIWMNGGIFVEEIMMIKSIKAANGKNDDNIV